jgi:hypothetical protein
VIALSAFCKSSKLDEAESPRVRLMLLVPALLELLEVAASVMVAPTA